PELRRLPGRGRAGRHRRGPADPGQVQPVVTRAGGAAGRVGPLGAAPPGGRPPGSGGPPPGRPLPGPPAGLPVRLIQAEITITPAGGKPRTERVRLITTILDWRAAPAAELAACYAQRWEIENSYREIKVFTRGPGQLLRSQTPAGITQEIWALLCACQLTCAHRARAAATGGHDPDRISCTITLRAIRRASTITTEALATLLPPRRRRSYPRHRLTSTANRRAARAGLTGAITCKITIIAPARANDLPGP